MASSKHTGILFSGAGLYRQGLRFALCDLAFLADNLRRDVHAGYGFGTNYDIPVVILRKRFGIGG